MSCAGLKYGVKTVALTILRRGDAVRDGLLRAAAASGRCLVLCYHCVAPRSGPQRVIEPIPPERFAEQLRALKTIGEIMPLNLALSCHTHGRPVFAVTFDDDNSNHVRYALPILRELEIPATFFLSGRSLHGLGPYWWSLLEQSVEEVGLAATAHMLGWGQEPLSERLTEKGSRPLFRTVKELARACRRAATVKELSPRVVPPVMKAEDIRSLAQAGMTIGFHTLQHAALPLLGDAELKRALTEGREALSAAAGVNVEFLAYPYGRADARVAGAARRAGYTAAFATGGRPVRRASDPFFLSRWQPGPLNARELLGEATLRLAMPSALSWQHGMIMIFAQDLALTSGLI